MVSSFLYFDLLALMVTGVENSTIRSIMYVAIFVVCMLFLSGALKNYVANNSVKPILDEFLNYLRKGDFESFRGQYPSFIQFRDSSEATAHEKLEDIIGQQRVAFQKALWQFNLGDVAYIKIEKVVQQPFQYESMKNTLVIGKLVYNNGSLVNFSAMLQQNKMYSFMIGEECVLNDKCHHLS